jgi:hypothetical protein
MDYFMKENGEIDMVSLILTVVIAAVTMMVGLVIASQVDLGMPANIPTLINTTGSGATGAPAGVLSNITTNTKFGISVLSGSYTNVVLNSGTAFNFLALGLFVLAAVFIIGIIAGVLGKGE